MTEELKPKSELEEIIALKNKPVTGQKKGSGKPPSQKKGSGKPPISSTDKTDEKPAVEKTEKIDVSKYNLPDLDLTEGSSSNQPVAKPGLLAHWWATKHIGEAQAKGWIPVVGHDTPFLEYPTQYQLCPGTNWLTNDGGQSIIVVCKEADYNAQVAKRAADNFALTVPSDIQITR